LEGAGIDCSGLVHISARIAGVLVPRDAHHQWALLRVDVDWAELRPGDLLFFGQHAGLDGIDHVGFHLGDGQLLHAPATGRAVVVEPVSVRGRDRVVAFGRF
jgi:cell wall-associated NlpC family hydrolase